MLNIRFEAAIPECLGGRFLVVWAAPQTDFAGDHLSACVVKPVPDCPMDLLCGVRLAGNRADQDWDHPILAQMKAASLTQLAAQIRRYAAMLPELEQMVGKPLFQEEGI